MTDIFTKEQAQRFKRFLEHKEITHCKKCGKPLDLGDMSWNGAHTEAGTPCSRIFVECEKCNHENYDGVDWGDLTNIDDVLDHLLGESDFTRLKKRWNL